MALERDDRCTLFVANLAPRDCDLALPPTHGAWTAWMLDANTPLAGGAATALIHCEASVVASGKLDARSVRDCAARGHATGDDGRVTTVHRSAKSLGRPARHVRAAVVQPHDIAAQLDARGRYEVPLDASSRSHHAVPLRTTSTRAARRGTSASSCSCRSTAAPCSGWATASSSSAAGDLLVVDNLKLHHVVDFDGFDTRALVVSFRPEFVYSLGSPSYDYAFLLPFYAAAARRARVLPLPEHRTRPTRWDGWWRAGSPSPTARCSAPAARLSCCSCCSSWRGASRSELLHWEFLRQQQRSLRLKPLFDHVRDHYADKLTVADAAAIVA